MVRHSGEFLLPEDRSRVPRAVMRSESCPTSEIMTAIGSPRQSRHSGPQAARGLATRILCGFALENRRLTSIGSPGQFEMESGVQGSRETWSSWLRWCF